MGFQLRINFTDIIQKDSLHATWNLGVIDGYSFHVRLSYYRGLFLSCIDTLALVVDGKEVEGEDILFCLNGKQFTTAQLPYLISEFWRIRDEAIIKVHLPGGLSEGEHEINFTLLLRSPYLPMPGSDKPHDYAPINSCDQAVLTLR